MWSDNETSVDYIDFQHYVSVLTGIIENDDLLPCSIGIHGAWGSGKSSLMQMVQKHYDDKDDYLIVKFNGWQFEGYEDAKTVLMGRIIEVIGDEKRTLPKVADAARKLLRKIDFWKLSSSLFKVGVGLATGPGGLAALTLKDVLTGVKDADSDGIVKAEEDEKSLRRSIHDFHTDFGELIALTKIKRLIVVIDDLDRCLPETVIGTLEAIKLFLFTPNTAFIIGADEHLIRHAVRKRFESTGEERELGREYLEKLIQFPVRIHQLNVFEMETYMNLLFARLSLSPENCEALRCRVMADTKPDSTSYPYTTKNAKELLQANYSALQDTLLLTQQIGQVLMRGLNGNPRLCKRFLNTLIMRQNMAKHKGVDLKNSILAKMMLLEYFKPEQFKVIYTSLDSTTGISLFLSAMESGSNISSQSEEGAGPDLELWNKDPWLNTWIKLEPKLGDEDLRFYFFYSRDKLSVHSGSVTGLSRTSQEIFEALKSGSEILLKRIEKEIPSLSPAEASGLFGSMVDTIKGENVLDSRRRLTSSLYSLVKIRRELMSEYITFLGNALESDIDASLVVKLEELLNDAQYKIAAHKLLNNWAASETNPQLAKIIKARKRKK